MGGGKESIEASLAAESLAQPEGICTKTNQPEGLSSWRYRVVWKHLFHDWTERFLCSCFFNDTEHGRPLLFLYCKLYFHFRQMDIPLILWIHFLYCVGWGGPRPPPGLMIIGITHRAQHIVIFRAKIYHCERIQNLCKSAKERHMEQCSEDTSCKLASVLSR